MKTLKLFNNKFQYRIFLFVVFLLFSSLGGLAQNITINGIVSDQSGQPLPGASVLVKGNSKRGND